MLWSQVMRLRVSKGICVLWCVDKGLSACILYHCFNRCASGLLWGLRIPEPRDRMLNYRLSPLWHFAFEFNSDSDSWASTPPCPLFFFDARNKVFACPLPEQHMTHDSTHFFLIGVDVLISEMLVFGRITASIKSEDYNLWQVLLQHANMLLSAAQESCTIWRALDWRHAEEGVCWNTCGLCSM